MEAEGIVIAESKARNIYTVHVISTFTLLKILSCQAPLKVII